MANCKPANGKSATNHKQKAQTCEGNVCKNKNKQFAVARHEGVYLCGVVSLISYSLPAKVGRCGCLGVSGLAQGRCNFELCACVLVTNTWKIMLHIRTNIVIVYIYTFHTFYFNIFNFCHTILQELLVASACIHLSLHYLTYLSLTNLWPTTRRHRV